jgi:hypothetical protein
MRRVVKGVLISLMITGLIAGCKKGEEHPGTQMPPQMPAAPMGQMPQMPAAPMGQMPQMPAAPMGQMPPNGAPKVQRTVVVPDTVKGKWSKVVLDVADKGSKKSGEYTVKLKSQFKIPNTDLKIAVGEFLPDFRMNGSTLTSASDEPNNPAVRVEIFEGGKSIFKGWLYAKFPSAHPFEHPKYAITLKQGVKS